MRLIDVDALVEDLEYEVELDARALDDTDLVGIDREIIQFDKNYKESVVDMLKKAPTVDAEPVRHGRWKHYARMLVCSECRTALYDDVIKCFSDVPRYCPECGAKMDMEEQDDWNRNMARTRGI